MEAIAERDLGDACDFVTELITLTEAGLTMEDVGCIGDCNRCAVRDVCDFQPEKPRDKRYNQSLLSPPIFSRQKNAPSRNPKKDSLREGRRTNDNYSLDYGDIRFPGFRHYSRKARKTTGRLQPIPTIGLALDNKEIHQTSQGYDWNNNRLCWVALGNVLSRNETQES